MRRTTLLASTLAALLAGSAAFAFAAQTPGAAPASAPAATSTRAPMTRMPMDHGMQHGAMQRGHFRRSGNHMRDGVIGDLRGLARLYDQAGRGKEMVAVYNDVLTRSQDPRVRNYVYRQLARLQARPTNVDAAIATLRKGLDENIANEAKMRAEREQMRSRWQQQRKGQAQPAPAAGLTD